ncbi:MAG: hypothetical protein A4E28_00003 [Methanocella sp. PtaU1.Bin125]|nr:MAG: hypothetical protein A4E28_00003 [Methanocella sp. PtaU1.Bin125]
MKRLLLILFALIFLVSMVPMGVADQVNSHPPIGDTTAYNQFYRDNDWVAYAYTGGNLYTNQSEVTGSFYHAVSDNNMMRYSIKLNDGDRLNYTFTLRDGSALSGWVVKESTGIFNSRITFSLDGVTQATDVSKLLFFDIGHEAIMQYYIYNVNQSDQQLAVGCNVAGLVVSPILDMNDTMTSLFVEVSAGSPLVVVHEHFWDGTITNSNGAGWIPDANGTAVPVLPNGNAVQNAIEAFLQLYEVAASLFMNLLFAVQLIAAIVMFFLDPLVMLLCLVLVESAGAALIFNSNKNIFIKVQRFGKFNMALFSVLLSLAHLLIGFFYYMLDIMAKIPDIITKIVNTATDLISKVVAIGIQIGAFILMLPK